MPIPNLDALFNDDSRTRAGETYYTGRLLCLDPGETTGYAVFLATGAAAPLLEESGQLHTKTVEIAHETVAELFTRVRPEKVIFENYLVYSWKAKDHSFQELVTPQIIAVIKIMCKIQGVSYDTQMASQAKGFCDDDKLKAWGLWIKGKKHARDAIRHGIYWLLFTNFSNQRKAK